MKEQSELGEQYTDDELVYAAQKRCLCGAGLAYPVKFKNRMTGEWDCSQILKGLSRRIPGVFHERKLPFYVFIIPEETRYNTTRPSE